MREEMSFELKIVFTQKIFSKIDFFQSNLEYLYI